MGDSTTPQPPNFIFSYPSGTVYRAPMLQRGMQAMLRVALLASTCAAVELSQASPDDSPVSLFQQWSVVKSPKASQEQGVEPDSHALRERSVDPDFTDFANFTSWMNSEEDAIVKVTEANSIAKTMGELYGRHGVDTAGLHGHQVFV